MAIYMECPGCDHPMNVPSHLGGRTIRCNYCGEAFRVTGDEDNDQPREKRGSKLVWYITGGVGGLIGIVTTVILLVLSGEEEPTRTNVAATQPPPNAAPQPQPQPQAQPQPNPEPANPHLQVPNDPAVIGPIELDVPPPPEPRKPISFPVASRSPVQREVNPDRDPVPDEDFTWASVADPLAEAPSLLPTFQLAQQVPLASRVLFPSTPDLVYAVGRNGSANERRASYDLVTRRAIGTITGQLPQQVDPVEALSPDGKRLAVGNNNLVHVWSFETGKELAELFSVPGNGKSSWVDFPPEPEDVLIYREPVLSRMSITAPVGQQEHWKIDFGPQSRADNFALSPNRKFLALTDDHLKIFQVEDGQLVAERSLPDGRCFDLIFSPDGEELAGLFMIVDAEGKRYQIAAWVTDTGELRVLHELTGDVSEATRTLTGLEYLSNARDWLVDGEFIVEHDTGAILTQLPVLENANLDSRHVLPGDRITSLDETPMSAVFVAVALDQRLYQAARETARQGVVQRVPNTEVDRAMIELKPLETPDAWSINLAPITVPQGWKEVDLGIPAADIFGVTPAGPYSPIAVTLAKVEVTEPYPRETLRVDRFDLEGGRSAGAISLPTSPTSLTKDWKPVVDVTPDGSMVALVDPLDARAVDVYRFDPAEHVLGFRPFGNDGPAVAWVAFAKGGRLLTLGEDGELVGWSFPECEPIFRVNVDAFTPAIHPSRGLVAVFSESHLVLLDPETGDVKGQLDVGQAEASREGESPVALAAFHPDGQSLAVAVSAANFEQRISIWDLATGEQREAFPAYAVGGSALQWCGQTMLMQDGWHVFDLTMDDLLWSYSTETDFPYATRTPDGRHWYVGIAGDQKTGVLRVVDLEQRLQHGPAVRAISLSVSVAGVGTEKFREAMIDRLEQFGYRVEEGQPLRLTITGTQTQSDREVVVEGGGKVFLPKVEGSMKITGPDGKACWEVLPFGIPPSNYANLNTSESVPTLMSRFAWQGFQNSALSTHIPTGVMLINNTATLYPGTSTLPGREVTGDPSGVPGRFDGSGGYSNPGMPPMGYPGQPGGFSGEPGGFPFPMR